MDAMMRLGWPHVDGQRSRQGSQQDRARGLCSDFATPPRQNRAFSDTDGHGQHGDGRPGLVTGSARGIERNAHRPRCWRWRAWQESNLRPSD
jgi:hypothetical protein